MKRYSSSTFTYFLFWNNKNKQKNVNISLTKWYNNLSSTSASFFLGGGTLHHQQNLHFQNSYLRPPEKNTCAINIINSGGGRCTFFDLLMYMHGRAHLYLIFKHKLYTLLRVIFVTKLYILHIFVTFFSHLWQNTYTLKNKCM